MDTFAGRAKAIEAVDIGCNELYVAGTALLGWQWVDRPEPGIATGLRIDLELSNSVFVTNQIDAGVQACVQAVGFGRFLDYHVQAEINAGSLVHVLKKFESEPVPARIVFPSSRQQSPNVRGFVRFAQQRLRDRLNALQPKERSKA